MDSNDALILIFSRNAFYKRLHYLALALFGLSLLIIIALLYFLYFLKNDTVKPLYFATDNVTRLTQVTPVTEPNMTTTDVIAWTIKAVETAYSYDYINFRSELQSSEKYFTKYGWSQYIKALNLSNNLVAVEQRKIIMTAKIVDTPKIITEGILGGAYAWKFQMPMLVTYSLPPYDDKSIFSNALELTVIVQRQTALRGDNGLGIVQIIGSFPSTTPSQPKRLPAP